MIFPLESIFKRSKIKGQGILSWVQSLVYNSGIGSEEVWLYGMMAGRRLRDGVSDR